MHAASFVIGAVGKRRRRASANDPDREATLQQYDQSRELSTTTTCRVPRLCSALHLSTDCAFLMPSLACTSSSVKERAILKASALAYRRCVLGST